MEDLERILSNASISDLAGLERSSSCPDFVSNADAPPGFSLKRKTSQLEQCVLKRKAAAGASEAAQPFMPLSAPNKKTNVRAEIQARNVQLRVVSSASALQRSSSAPQLPVESRGSLTVAGAAGSQAPGADRQMLSTGRLQNAVPISTLSRPSNDNIVQNRLKRAAAKPSRFRD